MLRTGAAGRKDRSGVLEHLVELAGEIRTGEPLMLVPPHHAAREDRAPTRHDAVRIALGARPALGKQYPMRHVLSSRAVVKCCRAMIMRCTSDAPS